MKVGVCLSVCLPFYQLLLCLPGDAKERKKKGSKLWYRCLAVVVERVNEWMNDALGWKRNLQTHTARKVIIVRTQRANTNERSGILRLACVRRRGDSERIFFFFPPPPSLFTWETIPQIRNNDSRILGGTYVRTLLVFRANLEMILQKYTTRLVRQRYIYFFFQIKIKTRQTDRQTERQAENKNVDTHSFFILPLLFHLICCLAESWMKRRNLDKRHSSLALSSTS